MSEKFNFPNAGIFLSEESNINTSSSPLNDQSTESEKIESISKKQRQVNGKFYIKEQMQQKREIRKRKLAEKNLLKIDPSLSPSEMSEKLKILTDEALQMPKLDPKFMKTLPPEERKKLKKQEQKMKNRISAQISRDKKKAEREQMEVTISEFQGIIRQLKQENSQLRDLISGNKSGICKKCGHNNNNDNYNLNIHTSQSNNIKEQECQNNTNQTSQSFIQLNPKFNQTVENNTIQDKNLKEQQLKSDIFNEYNYENLKLSNHFSSFNSTTNETQEKKQNIDLFNNNRKNEFDLFDIIETENSKLMNKLDYPLKQDQQFYNKGVSKHIQGESQNQQINFNQNIQINQQQQLNESNIFQNQNQNTNDILNNDNDYFPTYGRDQDDMNDMFSQYQGQEEETQENNSSSNKNQSTDSELNSSFFMEKQDEELRNQEYLIRSPVRNNFSFGQKMFSFTLLCVCLLFVFTGNFGTNNLQGSQSNFGYTTQFFQNSLETAINQIYGSEDDFQNEAMDYINQHMEEQQQSFIDPIEEYNKMNNQIDQEVKDEVQKELQEMKMGFQQINKDDGDSNYDKKNLEQQLNQDKEESQRKNKNQIMRKQFEQSLKENTYQSDAQQKCLNQKNNQENSKNTEEKQKFLAKSNFINQKTNIEEKTKIDNKKFDYLQNPAILLEQLKKNGDLLKIQKYIEDKYQYPNKKQISPLDSLSTNKEELKLVKMKVNGKQMIKENLISQNQYNELIQQIKQNRETKNLQNQKNIIGEQKHNKKEDNIQEIIMNEKNISQDNQYDFENDHIEFEMNESVSDEYCSSDYQNELQSIKQNIQNDKQIIQEEMEENSLQNKQKSQTHQEQQQQIKGQDQNKTFSNAQQEQQINQDFIQNNQSKQLQQIDMGNDDKFCEDESIQSEFEDTYYQISCLITGIQNLSFDSINFIGKYN